MSLTLDAARLPAFAGRAGSDGLLSLTVCRRKAPDFGAGTHGSLDGQNARMGFDLLPYPGYRDIYHLTPEPHSFGLFFTKPMDRASVERSLVLSSGAVDKSVWSFDWVNDTALNLVLAPVDGTAFPADVRIYPEGALDQDGLPIWFTEPLVLRWTRPTEVVLARADNLLGDQTVVFPPSEPPGVFPAGWSRPTDGDVGSTAIFLEPARSREETPTRYLLWLCRSGIALDWESHPEVEPFLRARWLDARSIFLDRGRQWEILRPLAQDPDAERVKVDLDASAYRWLGVYPSPQGDRVAAFRAPWPESGAAASVDLVLFDLGGRELQVLPAVTRLSEDDFYLDRVAAAWLPSGDGIVFVDRQADGGTALVRLAFSGDSAGGPSLVVPGTTGAERWQGEALAVFGGPGGDGAPVCVASRFSPPGSSQGEFRVLELETGRAIFMGTAGAGDLPLVAKSLPSPDGSRLAVTGEGRTLVLGFGAGAGGAGDAGAGEQAAAVTSTAFEGTAVEWAADGNYLYFYRPGR